MKEPKDISVTRVDRRKFIKSAGTGLLAAQIAPAPGAKTASSTRLQPVRFSPNGGLTQISPSLYLLRDTCNVYVVKNGDRAILIDFGSGHVLKLLGQIGVTKVDAILHTHHHRDQCQGGARAVAERIPIHVPAHERHLFEDAENFWRNRQVFHNYTVRNDFQTITHDLPVAGVLHDYETFRWGSYEFLIYPTPGHTVGSISLIGQVDGKKVAFTGDLIHSPGKVINLYDLQYQYAMPDGVDFAIFSLTKIRESGVELACPSHGEPMASPEPGIQELLGKLRDWYQSYGWGGGARLTIENKPFAVTPHLICSHQSTSTFYAIISDSGKALFVDYGAASWNYFFEFKAATAVRDRIRFVEHTIPDLKALYGMKSVDVAMPSHMHDDHLNGFPHLARHHGAKIWCYENMVDILQNPRGYNLGCLLGEPIKIDRALQNGETFKWKEFEFTVYHAPGHTEYQMMMMVNMDGARVAFTGDNYFPASGDAPYLRHNLIFRNWVENDSHMKSIRTLLEHQPTLMAPGHGKPFIPAKDDLEVLEQRLKKQQQYFSSVIADPDCNFGLNPNWIRFYPYQLLAKVGTSPAVELHVRNYRTNPMQLEMGLELPFGWRASPEILRWTVPPSQDGVGKFILSIPSDWDPSKPRVAIAADVVENGEYRGQIAEGVVDLQFGT